MDGADNQPARQTVATVPVDTLAQPRRVITGRVHWKTTFAAFQHRNYRLFFAGQFISLIGTWMQTVAEGWLVYQLSNSSLVLGLIRFLHTIPVTLLTLVGGAIADRMDKRRILLLTQFCSMLLAFALAALVYFDVVRIWHIAALGLCLGVAHAFDIPARQSFVIEMVGRNDLMNAIALNSSVFNAARIVGPAIAGMIIASISISGCFFVNGLSFLAVIASYLAMRLPRVEHAPPSQSLRQATREVFRFLSSHAHLPSILGLVAITSLFGWPYSILMPVFARDILQVGAGGYGYLMSANGVGALAGAITLAALGDSVDKRRLLFIGVFGFSILLVVFAFSRSFWLSAAALVLAGWCMIIFFATANTLVQLGTPDELRGRVMGLYSLCFLGLTPFGSLLSGTVAKWSSAPAAVVTGAAICCLGGLFALRFIRPFARGQRSSCFPPPGQNA